jgi:2-octaprenylphenol hydroxylase
MQKFDVIIIGGGVVGLTQACLLAQQKLSVVVIDQQPAPTADLKYPYDIRVNAIHHASQAIFNALGVWQLLTARRVSSYSHMRVSDAQSPAQIEFASSDIAQPCLGYIVEQSVMRRALWDCLQQYPQVKIIHSAEPVVLQQKLNEVEVKLTNEAIFSAPLLIGADGKDSWVAKQLNQLAADAAGNWLELIANRTALSLDARRAHNENFAIVTTLRTEHPHHNIALQRFLSTGPVALLPLADPHLVSLVWSTTQQQATALQQLTEGAFNIKLAQAMEYALGELAVCEQRITFPLFCHQAKHYVKARIALVGDAAHTILPLAGQGLNLGLLDAACLAQVVVEAYKKQQDIGAIRVLRRYERWRKGENTAMLLAMEGFQRIFSSSMESARVLRHTSFAITQQLPWLKKYFMARAMGLRGDLPEVAKASLHL